MPKPLRLGVNVDHVATLRNARGTAYPAPLRAAQLAVASGADGITAHLREDRRHIRDADIAALKAALTVPLNFEMAPTAEMQAIALRTAPHACCLVPEKREEVTTEGGLDIVADQVRLTDYVGALAETGIRVSMFIGHDPHQIEAAHAIGAQVVELHTGHFCDLHYAGHFAKRDLELEALRAGAGYAASLGLEVHAGHGLTFETVSPIAEITEIRELNIGHFLIGESVFLGLGDAIVQMRALMDAARGGV
ncbi:MAG TPA: pyridoxine 5'-phosphate synthase [Paenirhodobacter sp.]